MWIKRTMYTNHWAHRRISVMVILGVEVIIAAIRSWIDKESMRQVEIQRDDLLK